MTWSRSGLARAGFGWKAFVKRSSVKIGLAGISTDAVCGDAKGRFEQEMIPPDVTAYSYGTVSFGVEI